MKNYLFMGAFICTIGLISVPAHAETFEDRVQAAHEAEDQKTYQDYFASALQAAGQQLASAMETCTKDNPSKEGFTLVSDIDSEGKPENTDVKPVLPVAKCFADHWKALLFPAPPEYPGRKAFPVAIEMHVTK